MSSLFQTILVGIGATITMDVYSFILNAFGIKTLNYKFLGRWIGHFFNGKFSHRTIFTAPSIKHEHIIGWITHYTIGIIFTFFLVLIFDKKWLENPTLLPALAIGVVTVVAPFFFMQPAFGLGITASNTPHPIKAQIMSLITHAVFGFGLFLSAKILSILVK